VRSHSSCEEPDAAAVRALPPSAQADWSTTPVDTNVAPMACRLGAAAQCSETATWRFGLAEGAGVLARHTR
jgi:hypothetical protein